MSSKVALVGATGNLGPKILAALLSAGFSVTIFTRVGSTSTASLPPHANQTIVEVDYDSVSSLTSALQSHAYLVSTLASMAVGQQKKLADAAIAAGVSRFLPSEFGSNIANPRTRALPVFAQKVELEDYLAEQVKVHPSFSYTLVYTSAFLDWGLDKGFIMDVRGRKAVIYDGGNNRTSLTTLADIGAGVVGVFRHLEETKNRAVRIQSAALSAKELLAIAQKVDPEQKEWEITEKSLEQVEKDGYALLQKGEIMPAVVSFLHCAIWSKDFGSDFSAQNDNKLLGLKGLTEAEVEDIVRAVY